MRFSLLSIRSWSFPDFSTVLILYQACGTITSVIMPPWLKLLSFLPGSHTATKALGEEMAGSLKRRFMYDIATFGMFEWISSQAGCFCFSIHSHQILDSVRGWYLLMAMDLHRLEEPRGRALAVAGDMRLLNGFSRTSLCSSPVSFKNNVSSLPRPLKTSAAKTELEHSHSMFSIKM